MFRDLRLTLTQIQEALEVVAQQVDQLGDDRALRSDRQEELRLTDVEGGVARVKAPDETDAQELLHPWIGHENASPGQLDLTEEVLDISSIPTRVDGAVQAILDLFALTFDVFHNIQMHSNSASQLVTAKICRENGRVFLPTATTAHISSNCCRQLAMRNRVSAHLIKLNTLCQYRLRHHTVYLRRL